MLPVSTGRSRLVDQLSSRAQTLGLSPHFSLFGYTRPRQRINERSIVLADCLVPLFIGTNLLSGYSRSTGSSIRFITHMAPFLSAPVAAIGALLMASQWPSKGICSEAMHYASIISGRYFIWPESSESCGCSRCCVGHRDYGDCLDE